LEGDDEVEYHVGQVKLRHEKLVFSVRIRGGEELREALSEILVKPVIDSIGYDRQRSIALM
jgi:hypothetical protein